MQSFAERQASTDYHLEVVRRCLAMSVSPPSDDLDPLQCHEDVVEQPRHGTPRIAAKIIHLRNRIATLTPVPATTEADQSSMFDRFRTLWGDRREYGARDRTDAQPHLVRQVHHVDPPVSRRSLEFSSTSTSRHRRAGSSKI